MTQVFLLGTHHFKGDYMDIFSEDSQRQLRLLNDNLAHFNPDAVCVEEDSFNQQALDTAYSAMPENIFLDYDAMQREPVGSMQVQTLGGMETRTLTYENEIPQIGMRLAKTVGLKRIYAIDETSNMALFDIPEKYKAVYDRHFAWMSDWKNISETGNGTLYDRIVHANSEKWSYHNHQLYVALNVVGAGSTHEGADFLGEWYRRNLRIFANLQLLSETHQRIFAVYGAGHLYVLRELVNACENMKLVDWREYM
ncbi:MAG: DUF5694 domain-containing protein [Defluviitaleaceae bacterium]|nr:DUF5694 domain-containing protein [Defluviitaleaceae bacterium]